MANQNAQSQNATETTQKSAKAQYDEIILTYKDHSPLAKQVGEAVITSLMSSTANPASVEVMKEISEASQRGDEDKLFELMAKLKNIKDAEKTHQKKIAELRKGTDWAEIQQAFKAEFEALTYQAALSALKAAHQAINASTQGTAGNAGKRGRKPRDPNAEPTGPNLPRVALKGVYKIKTKDGEYTLEAGKKGQVGWAEHTALLEDLGIPHKLENVNGKDKVVFTEDGVKVNKDDNTVYARTIASIIQGVINGVYDGATAKEVEAEKA